MEQYSSNQDFYNHIDEIIEILRSTEHSKSADKIYSLIHKVTWTTSTELFEELRNEFVALNESKTNLPTRVGKPYNNLSKRLT
jgi:hypothetical protein